MRLKMILETLLSHPLIVGASLLVAFVLARLVRWVLKPVLRTLVVPANAAGDDIKEAYFIDEHGAPRAFPSLLMPTAREGNPISLSVVVPAYNEEKRLGKMLTEAIAHLTKTRKPDEWEIIVVDDGSKDGTFELGMRYTREYGSERIRILKSARNNGKGGAVRKGMLRARGEMVLMADADGATEFAEVDRLIAALKKHDSRGGVIVGSRRHLMNDPKMRRVGLRAFVSNVFGLLVSLMVPAGIRDTQCGFKLFPREVAQFVFPQQKLYGWVFDVELLYLASVRGGYPITEVAVRWVDVEGSTLNVTTASLEMLRDLILLRILYGLRIW